MMARDTHQDRQLDRDLLVRAFVTYVRTLMEYNSVVWSSDLKRDIDAIEKVYKNACWTEETILWPKIEISKRAPPRVKAPSHILIVVL